MRITAVNENDIHSIKDELNFSSLCESFVLVRSSSLILFV